MLMASQDTVTADASLLRKHSHVISVTTDSHTYLGIRVFYRAHPKASLLPPKLPLVVFIHGLGGQIQQFQHVIDYLVHFSHVLAIDLPGCGGSSFAPKDWDAYSTPALCSLIAKAIDQFRGEDQEVVLVGHSMGCALAATLVTKGGLLEHKAAGLIAICPKATLSEKEQKAAAAAVKLPEFVFNMFRVYDRRGGLHSKSVSRFVGTDAPDDIRKMQLRFNEQSKTPVWQRMVNGIQLPTREQWMAIKLPILLLGATEDKVTPVQEVDMIHSWFDPSNKTSSISSQDSGNADAPSSHSTVVKKCIIPSAGHGVMYESPNVLCGLLGEFMSKHVNEVLSLGWQLSYLKEDKWLLKNLEKWNRTQPVSPRIVMKTNAGPAKISPFRAMKTLRQNDANGHNPIEFSNKWTDVRDIIDLSHESPPYDPSTFGGGLKYHKYPTVSKMPPTPDEVAGFIKLVDSIREARGYDENSVIACHCHYGFNRTGFFICTYLIERLGFSVKESIESFKEARPPGIRHPHFINELFERYCLGLMKAPTF
ncbi:Alpha/Beta hydrolase protein [Trichophaea hybrida]|nr:Alpha/Beta hydrolase protein [Trichophaea hybrida]